MSKVGNVISTIFTSAKNTVGSVAKKTNTSIFTPAKKVGIKVCDAIPYGRETRLDVNKCLKEGEKIKRASNIKKRQLLNRSDSTGAKKWFINLKDKSSSFVKGTFATAKKAGALPAVAMCAGFFPPFIYYPLSSLFGLAGGFYMKNVLKGLTKSIF